MTGKAHFRHGRWVPLLAVVLTACGGRQVQLLFPPQNDNGEYWKCPVADVEARPEHRKNRCTPVPGGPGPEVGNRGRVAYVEVRPCEGAIRTITIVDADSSTPTAYVTCGQTLREQAPTQTAPLNGDIPLAGEQASGAGTDTAPPPTSAPPASTPRSDLNGGLPPPAPATPARNP